MHCTPKHRSGPAQQNYAPCHTRNNTQEWPGECNKELKVSIWPQNSQIPIQLNIHETIHGGPIGIGLASDLSRYGLSCGFW